MWQTASFACQQRPWRSGGRCKQFGSTAVERPVGPVCQCRVLRERKRAGLCGLDSMSEYDSQVLFEPISSPSAPDLRRSRTVHTYHTSRDKGNPVVATGRHRWEAPVRPPYDPRTTPRTTRIGPHRTQYHTPRRAAHHRPMWRRSHRLRAHGLIARARACTSVSHVLSTARDSRVLSQLWLQASCISSCAISPAI